MKKELHPSGERIGDRFEVVVPAGMGGAGTVYRARDLLTGKVAPGEIFCIAVYCRTKFCALWRLEKRLYTASPAWLRSSAALTCSACHKARRLRRVAMVRR